MRPRSLIGIGVGILCWPALFGAELSGPTDIYWTHRVTRMPTAWIMDQTRFVDAIHFPDDAPTGWLFSAVADFNRDREPDFVWRNPTTGSNTLWLMRGANRVSTIPLPDSPTSHDLAATADIDGDGSADLIWRSRSSDETIVWFMEGTRRSDRPGRLAPFGESDWQLAASGDLNSDGYADLFWRNQTNGRNLVWLMAGTNVLSKVELKPNHNLADRLSAVGRFDRVGNFDLVWQNTNGVVVFWMMSGTNFLESVPLRPETDQDWVIVGTGGYNQSSTPSIEVGSTESSLALYWGRGMQTTPDIERRELGSTEWLRLAEKMRGTRFTDESVRSGITYEYKSGEQRVRGALRAPAAENRGSLILVVERSLESPLRNELEQFRSDLVGDGWRVIRTNAPRHDDVNWARNTNAIALLKQFILSQRATQGADLKTVILVGHVPIPYSGFQNPDGHAWRSLPADGYYGDVDGRFTDAKNYEPAIVEGLADRRWSNVARDGKWDQESYPPNQAGVAELELSVGRIDFSKLPEFKSSTEIELLRRYLEKDHRYRHKLLNFPSRIIAGAFLPAPAVNQAVYREAVGLAAHLFGSTSGELIAGEPFRDNSSALWGLHAAWGLPYGIRTPTNSYFTTAELADPLKETKLGFVGVYGSYLEDWEYTNNLMRAFLATSNSGLGALWFQPKPETQDALSFEGLGLGETIGESWLHTVNNSEDTKKTFLAYLGDPTLRMQVATPPSELVVSRIASGVRLTWSSSPERGLAHFVYRSGNGLDGPWTRLNNDPVEGVEFLDRNPPLGKTWYQVRALSLTVTGSGSFTNLSQAAFGSAR